MNKEKPVRLIYIHKKSGKYAAIVLPNIIKYRFLFFQIPLIAVRFSADEIELVGQNKFMRDYEPQNVNNDEWTPLESAEKTVIERQLFLNSWNKNRTRKDLGITINTLNAKIIKYGMVKPL